MLHVEHSVTSSPSIRIAAKGADGIERGHIFLVLITNDSGKGPYGLIEDLYVDEAFRKQGVGTTLMKEVIEEARRRGCYKLLATSRHEREFLHTWYQKLGFKNWGVEFRMDL